MNITSDVPTATNASSGVVVGDERKFDPIMEKAWWTIDYRIVPMMAILLSLSLIDATNLGNARIAELQQDLKMTDRQFSMLIVANTVPNILASLPMSLVLKAIGPNIMLPTMLTLYAIPSTLQGIVKSYQELLICRIFLGLFQAGFFPGTVLYLSLWYPRRHLQKRISVIVATSSITDAFSGIFAYGIVRMDGVGQRPGWAWIFILEGALSFTCGILAFIVLPRSPVHTRFLHGNKKAYVIEQLRNSGAIAPDEEADSFRWREVGQAFLLPHVWMLSILALSKGVTVGVIVYFTPSIVASIGYTNVQAQLYSVPPIALGSVCMLVSAYLSDRFGMRGVTIITSSAFTTIGLAMFLAVESLHVKYGSLFLIISGAYSSAPAANAWIANNAAPYTRRATAIGFTSVMFQLGSVIATWLLGTLSRPPLYKTATITLLVLSVIDIVISGMNIAYLSSQNRKKASIREKGSREREEPGLGDHSAWFLYSL